MLIYIYIYIDFEKEDEDHDERRRGKSRSNPPRKGRTFQKELRVPILKRVIIIDDRIEFEFDEFKDNHGLLYYEKSLK